MHRVTPMQFLPLAWKSPHSAYSQLEELKAYYQQRFHPPVLVEPSKTSPIVLPESDASGNNKWRKRKHNVAQCMQHPPPSTWKSAYFQLYLVRQLSIMTQVATGIPQTSSLETWDQALAFSRDRGPGGVDRRILQMSVAATNGDFIRFLVLQKVTYV